jgi:hypothetical protein
MTFFLPFQIGIPGRHLLDDGRRAFYKYFVDHDKKSIPPTHPLASASD